MKRSRLGREIKALAKKSRLKTIPALTISGGTLKHLEDAKEFRVWIHPKEYGDDYYYAYPTLEQAMLTQHSMIKSNEFSIVEEPVAVVWDKKKRKWSEVVVPDNFFKGARERIIRSEL